MSEGQLEMWGQLAETWRQLVETWGQLVETRGWLVELWGDALFFGCCSAFGFGFS